MNMQQTETLKPREGNWRNKALSLIFATASLTILGCNHEASEPCSSVVVDYQTDIKPIISRSCASQGCHNSSNGLGNFNDYDQLNAKCNDGSFQRRVLWKKDMPPSALDACDFIKLRKWFNEGHKKN